MDGPSLFSDLDPRYVERSILTTTGDIYVASGASNPIRVPVGDQCQVLQASSETTTGVAWKEINKVTIDGKVNEPGGVLSGQAVYITGATGNKPQFALASNHLHNPSHVFGIAADDGADGQTIRVRLSGELDNVDTSGFSEGARMHLLSGGTMQEAVPISGAHVHMGFVSKSNPNSGIMIVAPEIYAHDIRGTMDLDIEIAAGSNDVDRKVLFQNYSREALGFFDGAGLFSWQSGAVFNESGVDADFRVEGVGEANALFVQGSDGFIGMGTPTPETEVDILGTLTLRDSGDRRFTIVQNSGTSPVVFNTNNNYSFETDGNEKFIIDNTIIRGVVDFALGDEWTSGRSGTGNGPRNFTLLDTNAILRVWRWGAASPADPAIEFIAGTNNDVKNPANKWWDVFLKNDEDRLGFRRRTGNVSQEIMSFTSSQLVGINEMFPDAMLEIVTVATTEEGLKIKGSASQTGSLFIMTDSSDNRFFDSGDGLASSEVVWNQQGADIDFRVEGVGETNALFVQGSDGFVGMGTNAPINVLHLKAANPVLYIQDTEAASTSALSFIKMSDSSGGGAAEAAWRIGYNQRDFTLGFSSNDNGGAGTYIDYLFIDDATGNTAIGSDFTAPQGKFHVCAEQQTNVHYVTSVTEVIEDHETRRQLVDKDDGNAGNMVVYTMAPTSGDNKHWVMHHRGPSSNNRFDIAYGTSSSSPFDPNSFGACLTFTIGGLIGINETTADAMLEIVSNAAGEECLHLKGAVSQSASLMMLTDSNDTVLTEFEADGTMVLSGAATTFEDLNIGTVFLGRGASAPDLVTIDATSIEGPGFNGQATSEDLSGSVEIPHSYKNSSDITPHIHWMPSTTGAGDVIWNLEFFTISEVIDETVTGSTTISGSSSAGGTAWVGHRMDFPVISGAIGDQIGFRLFRDPTTSDDTYGADAVALTLGFHFESDTLGSRQILAK